MTATQPSSRDVSKDLITAASPLFALMSRIRVMPELPDMAHYRSVLIREVEAFSGKAVAMGFDPDTVSTARYALCASLDESVLSTPWGSISGWTAHGLAMTYYRDPRSGENFYLGLNHLMGDPGRNRPLLEVFYVCLALGFMGRLAIVPNGKLEQDRIRRQVYGVIRPGQEGVLALSDKWQGRPTRSVKPGYWTPFWWASFFCLLLALLVVLLFRMAIDRHAEPGLAALAGLEFAPGEQASPVLPTRKVTLTDLLRPEIAKGFVEVVETPGKAIVRIRGDELFASGSARINERFNRVIARVGQAVYTYGGMITITGHTDNRPLKTLSVRSNLELSEQRARHVMESMVSAVSDLKVTVIGRGDLDPIAPNDTPQNRARNRRVEIRVDTL